jgi:hypothetical protein
MSVWGICSNLELNATFYAGPFRGILGIPMAPCVVRGHIERSLKYTQQPLPSNFFFTSKEGNKKDRTWLGPSWRVEEDSENCSQWRRALYKKPCPPSMN